MLKNLSPITSGSVALAGIVAVVHWLAVDIVEDAPAGPPAGMIAPRTTTSPSPARMEDPASNLAGPVAEASFASAPPVPRRHRKALAQRANEPGESLLSCPPDLLRSRDEVSEWVRQLTPRERLATLEDLRNAGPEEPDRADVSARLIRRIAAGDVNAAIGEVETMPDGPARTLALENVAIVAANRKPDAVIKWVNGMPDDEERDGAAYAVAGEVMRSRPVDALRLAATLPPSDANDELIRRAVAEWAGSDQPAATDWARQISDDTLRTQALAAAALAWGDHDPGAAAAFALAELPPGRLRDDTLVGVAQRWAEQSPQAAAAWVQAWPDGELRTAALDSVATIRAQSVPTRHGTGGP